MNEEEKQKVIKKIHNIGLVVSFVTDKAIFVTDGDMRKSIKWEDFNSELEKLK